MACRVPLERPVLMSILLPLAPLVVDLGRRPNVHRLHHVAAHRNLLHGRTGLLLQPHLRGVHRQAELGPRGHDQLVAPHLHCYHVGVERVTSNWYPLIHLQVGEGGTPLEAQELEEKAMEQ
jgi:hypothetical protein